MKSLILTAGLGTRFKPYTDKVPKPAIPLMNVPMVFYNLHLLQQLELESLTFNVHHLPESMMAVITGSNKIGLPLHFSDEKTKLMGTGGALLTAKKYLTGRGTIVMSNSDVVSTAPLRTALAFHRKQKALATMVVMKHPEAGKKYGAVWVDKKKRVVGFGKIRPDAGCSPYHFIGYHFVEEGIFKFIPRGPCDILSSVYLPAIKKGELIAVHETRGLWLDCGDLEEYMTATRSLFELLPKIQHQPFLLSFFNRFWSDFEKRPSIWEGVGCEHQLGLGIEKNILLGNNCQVHPSVKVSGFAVIGNNSVIEAQCRLENAVIGDNVVVPTGRRVRNDIVLS